MSSSAQNHVLSQFVNCPTLSFRVLLLFLMRFVCLPESMYVLPFMRSFVSCLTLLFHVPTHSSQCQVCVCVSYPLLYDVALCFSLNCVLISFFLFNGVFFHSGSGSVNSSLMVDSKHSLQHSLGKFLCLHCKRPQNQLHSARGLCFLVFWESSGFLCSSSPFSLPHAMPIIHQNIVATCLSKKG